MARQGKDENSLLRRFLSEPLAHFALLGFAIFVALPRVLGEPDTRPAIVIDSAFIEGLRELHGDAATDEALVESYLRQELLYREALRLGLDEGDEIVRRRLVQKMEAVLSAGVETASDAELAEYLSANRASFAQEARFTFEHRFYSQDRRDDALLDAQTDLLALNDLRGAQQVQGADEFLYGNRFDGRGVSWVAGRFGNDFVVALTNASLAEAEDSPWQGPVRSPFGVHLFRVISIEPARLPELSEVRGAVEAAWRQEAQSERLAAELARLRSETEVQVE